MDIPAMAVGGVTPVLPPLLIVFLILAAAGAVMLVMALMLRNFRLVTQGGLNPLNPADLQKAADPSVSTRPAGAVRFAQTIYARVAFALLVAGGVGILGMGLWGLFGG